MKCLICANDTPLLFETKLMHKYSVSYHRCIACGFIQTEKPYWLNEAYQNIITTLDIGLLSRNINLSELVSGFVKKNFDPRARYLDYGGGYGVLVRLLRDKGLNFYRQDIYCENIFAANRDITDLDENERRFELVTCFEVFEHTDEPYELLKRLKQLSPNILISTLLIPDRVIQSESDWWYFAPETGQHITFYTRQSFMILAEKLNMNFYTNGEDLHLFTTERLVTNPLQVKPNTFMNKIAHKIRTYLNPARNNGHALIEEDLNLAKAKAFGTQS